MATRASRWPMTARISLLATMFFALATAMSGPPLVIKRRELQPEPQALERTAELLERELGAEPDLVPACRLLGSSADSAWRSGW